MVIIGILLWSAAAGVHDSTVNALVADLVPRHRRATAYGIFVAVQGAGALAGGAAAGALYQHSRTALVVAVAISQAVALLVLITRWRPHIGLAEIDQITSAAASPPRRLRRACRVHGRGLAAAAARMRPLSLYQTCPAS
jgi:MFS family permease